MDTTELRIGNKVLYQGKQITVKNIFAKSINLEVDSSHRVISWIPINELDPIPVTTEQLRRLGFRLKYQRYMYPGIQEYFLVRRGEEFYFAMKQDYNELIQVNSIHELQNMMLDWFKVCLE